MKRMHRFLAIVSLLTLSCLFVSCAEPITDRDVVATLSLQNTCDGAMEQDSLDIVMRFIDTDTMPLVDADIYRRIPARDSLFKLNLRLKKSDSWWIKDIRRKSGSSFCTAFCDDTTKTCKATPGDTPFGNLHPVSDTIRMKITCVCSY